MTGYPRNTTTPNNPITITIAIMAVSFRTPYFITGGCLCNSLRYRVDFPENHDFKASVSPALLPTHALP